MNISNFDVKLIEVLNKISEPVARLGIFIVFFWFGFLKIIGLSSASPLVQNLFDQTMTGISFPTFMVIFGGFECIIGLLFLVKGWERVVVPFLFLHLITTFLPLWLLPTEAWNNFLVPTMEGQYIIKNLIIGALAIGIAGKLKPLTKSKKRKKIAGKGKTKSLKLAKTAPVTMPVKVLKAKKNLTKKKKA